MKQIQGTEFFQNITAVHEASSPQQWRPAPDGSTLAAPTGATDTSNGCTVSWGYPTDDGGSPIDLFDVFAANATAVDTFMLMSTYGDRYPAYTRTMVTRAPAAAMAAPMPA